ncbi:MAG: electron transport complex subunit RsxC [Bacteroidales bacterium]|nr:electron transport complex subunit RsxC [Bacteroidales bacterium]
MKKFTFKIGGVHPNDSKISAEAAIEPLKISPKIYISMAQHLGAPANPVVAVGDEVRTGQIIGEPSAFMSCYVHSSVTGKVVSVGPYKDIAGREAIHVGIDVSPDGDVWADGIITDNSLDVKFPTDRQTLLDKIKACGIVGLGGATFPTHVKLCPPPGSVAECLIINGAECEPYLTSDYRLMVERPEEVLTGVAIIKCILGCRAVVGIEENKPKAIESMKKALESLSEKNSEFNDIDILTLKKKYPQGGEKQLIAAVLGREVASGALPISVGAVVQNVGTALAVYEAVQKNKPLIDNTITVTGQVSPSQKNYLTRVGTPYKDIIAAAGGLPDGNIKVISGGPMMGRAVSNLDATTLKGTGAVLMLSEEQTKRKPAQACISCGRCVDACPMGLEPFYLLRLSRAGMMDALEENAVQDCIECGCCLYSCPSSIALLDEIRLAKASVMKIIKSRPRK